MARSGLTKSQVKASRDQLLAEGRYPSVDAVRHALGDTGSKSTIHKYLKELSAEDGQSGITREQTANSLQAMVEQLADRLHSDAEQRMELALQEKDAELAALRRQVAQLQARLDLLEVDGDNAHDQGFGNFSNLFASSRSGQRDDTPFNIILAGGRSMTIDFDSPQIRLNSAFS
ncbi:hypothetical protein GJ699_17995 [Duganella sp. FT80W]|uniref:KfrA N-terminal DNA-binding domain-containing protein n=1 Tax=Duganella guangzhouensis TaxID=2666084 RepID=A0A6I2L2H8_9BURK|nr:DNA-binding protein [Duganella guangzhouensis]MRW91890.1 hypothetical protein [Duganella guangzhouensis]